MKLLAVLAIIGVCCATLYEVCLEDRVFYSSRTNSVDGRTGERKIEDLSVFVDEKSGVQKILWGGVSRPKLTTLLQKTDDGYLVYDFDGSTCTCQINSTVTFLRGCVQGNNRTVGDPYTISSKSAHTEGGIVYRDELSVFYTPVAAPTPTLALSARETSTSVPEPVSREFGAIRNSISREVQIDVQTKKVLFFGNQTVYYNVIRPIEDGELQKILLLPTYCPDSITCV
ncbi:hypothetical protein AKO1_000992 [Acrasis kona]|uniref:Uncharacterized protein n=1 Tax=Acrasis kona TaxID=1008807 RepID=A0AAW2ZB52_9EUKA